MVGTTISHFKVLEKIGEGGMGEVYRAEDTNLSRDVAIKVLPEQFTKDPQRLARFEREAKLLASLPLATAGEIWLRIGCVSCGFLPRYSALCNLGGFTKTSKYNVPKGCLTLP